MPSGTVLSLVNNRIVTLNNQYDEVEYKPVLLLGCQVARGEQFAPLSALPSLLRMF